jgi:dTDP-D-glucose 4,6-dehydratase
MQTRSFLFVEECVEAVRRLVDSDVEGPVNTGSEEMILINGLAQLIIDISGKDISIKNIDGPTGVRGRNNVNKLIKEKLDWEPSMTLKEGMCRTFAWIAKQVEKRRPRRSADRTWLFAKDSAADLILRKFVYLLLMLVMGMAWLVLEVHSRLFARRDKDGSTVQRIAAV